jgi:aminopeptidase N
MKTETPPTIRLKDYKAFPFTLKSVRLVFKLSAQDTVVESEIAIEPKAGKTGPLVLDGEMIKLVSVAIDGRALKEKDFKVDEKSLIISKPPKAPFTLKIISTCAPAANTALSGLYMSNGMYCTQCEAEGFRRITYYPDRPDVMSKFHVHIEAPRSLPVLLSNGNPAQTGTLGEDKHFAEWDDPHPKPSYLFALVAGDLAHVEDHFTTSEGRSVKLGIYVEKGKEDRCAWAMESLKTSMRWDEQRFGRAYDLDVFNIVAVSDFNMGAMENKGLNIFNDKYILARPETATDTDFELIESIIAHEYFHNWTGNRITCRDWFQLCLKEGLTVFRDQEFTSDIRSRPVKRIDDLQDLRARQFPEDQGPLSHPVRPSSYIEINNFYTATVYDKGAELCRMLQTMIGPQAFRKAMDLYFERHDGEAATVENFVQCMADASGRDLAQFFRWYEQAGTPKVTVRGTYDAKTQRYELAVSQKTERRKGEPRKLPFHMPFRVGLVDASGQDMPLDIEGQGPLNSDVIELTEAKKVYHFHNVKEEPVLSFNRGYSAPVVLKTNQSSSDLLFLMGNDSDSFNRWEAAQVVAKKLIGKTYAALIAATALPNVAGFARGLGKSLKDKSLDNAFKAKLLQLPMVEEIVELVGKDVDAELIVKARDHVRAEVAKKLSRDLKKVADATVDHGAYQPDTEGTARRGLHFSSLGLLSAAEPDPVMERLEALFAKANNMTVEYSSLALATRMDHPRASALLNAFYERHHTDPLLIDKWFAVQSLMPGKAAKRVEALTTHKDFTWKTPNRVYALVRNFIGGNLAGFHAEDGEGYRLAAEAIITLNGINPQVASRLATGFRSWRMFNAPRRAAAQREMQRILAEPALSRDVLEIITRTLQV